MYSLLFFISSILLMFSNKWQYGDLITTLILGGLQLLIILATIVFLVASIMEIDVFRGTSQRQALLLRIFWLCGGCFFVVFSFL